MGRDAVIVCAFGITAAPPGRLIYHLWGRCEADSYERLISYTACGRIAQVYPPAGVDALVDGWYDPSEHFQATDLRRDQAELLGRPCKTCEAARG